MRLAHQQELGIENMHQSTPVKYIYYSKQFFKNIFTIMLFVHAISTCMPTIHRNIWGCLPNMELVDTLLSLLIVEETKKISWTTWKLSRSLSYLNDSEYLNKTWIATRIEKWCDMYCFWSKDIEVWMTFCLFNCILSVINRSFDIFILLP